jgi:hypothetical protein
MSTDVKVRVFHGGGTERSKWKERRTCVTWFVGEVHRPAFVGSQYFVGNGRRSFLERLLDKGHVCTSPGSSAKINFPPAHSSFLEASRLGSSDEGTKPEKPEVRIPFDQRTQEDMRIRGLFGV